MSQLPDGFVLDGQASAPAGLPEGFVLDGAAPSTGRDVARGVGTGLAEGVAGLAGMQGDIQQLGRTALAAGADHTIGRAINYLRGQGFTPTTGAREAMSGVRSPNITSGEVRGAVEGIAGPLPEPQTLPGQYARTIARNAPGAALGPGGAVGKAALAVVPGLAEESAGQIARRFAPSTEAYVRPAAGILSGLGTIAATGAANRAIAARGVERAAPTVDGLEAAGQAAYQRAEQAGVQFAAPSYRRAIEQTRDAAAKAGIDPALHPKATAALARLEDAVGTAPTLEEVGTLRRITGSAAASLDRDEARIGKLLQSQLDEFVNRARPSDVVAGDVRTASRALGEARSNWAAMRRAEMVERARDTGETRAGSTGVGGNVDNASRQNMRRLMESPKDSRGFNQQELDLMRRIVMGDTGQNMLRQVGRMAPSSGIVGTGIGSSAGAAIGGTIAGPMGAAVGAGAAPAIGQFAKMASDRMTQRNIDLLSAIVRSRPQGETQELTRLLQSLDPTTANVARALLLQRQATAPQPVNQPR